MLQKEQVSPAPTIAATGALVKRLAYYASVYTGSAVLLKLAGFLLFMWLARTLPPEQYAAWGLLYALYTGITAFGQVGIIEAVVALLRQFETRGAPRALFAAANGAFAVTLTSSLLGAVVLAVCLFGAHQIGLTTLLYVLTSSAIASYA